MKTNVPGIFIPFFEDVNLLVYHTEKNQFVESLSQREQYLSEVLRKNDIENTVEIACLLSFQPQKQTLEFKLGCMLTLTHPHQMEYVKAMKVLEKEFDANDLFKSDEYTVPLNSVQAAGFGQVTKTLYCTIDEKPSIENYKYHLNRLSTLLRQLYKQNGFSASLILVLGNEEISLQATSPIVLNDNYHAWQQYLSKALKREGFFPLFHTTWSTNAELTSYYKEKNRQLQEKLQKEYVEKISARNP